MEGLPSPHSDSGSNNIQPIIPVDWAKQQLQAHWPNISIKEALPSVDRRQLRFHAELPEVGEIGVRMFAADPADPHGGPRLTAAFHRAQAVAGHANSFAVPTLQAGSIGGCLVVVSAWKDGTPLPQYLQSQGDTESKTVPIESALAMIDTLAQALEIYHQAGWVHGHLRADSILVTGPNNILLSGHGFLDTLTGYLPDPLDANRIYIAPERNGRETEPPDVLGDVYGLGVIAYEILTGDKPVGAFMKLPSQVTGAGNWLDDVILRSIHSDPASRIQSASDFRKELAARRLQLMDLSKKDSSKDRRELKKMEESGSTAMLRIPFYAFMAFALLAVGGALWLGQTMYEKQAETQLSAVQAMAVMAEIASGLGDGEGAIDLETLKAQLAGADESVQLEAIAEKVAQLRAAGKHDEAMDLMDELKGMGSAGLDDAIDSLLGDVKKANDEKTALERVADLALAKGDLDAETEALEKLFTESPEDKELQRRIAQLPKYFAPSWEHVEKEVRRWNPEQKSWHVSMHRDGEGLEIDLSGHDKLHWVNGLKDLPIDRLDLRHTQVRDLGPLASMPLQAVWCDYTPIKSVRSLSDQPIEILGITHTKVQDHELLETFPFLKSLRVDSGAPIATKLAIPRSKHSWENSLGQRFRTVPGMSALVAIRETTELNYAPYAIASVGSGMNDATRAELLNEASLLPVLTDLEDALSFCKWLTDIEVNAGHLPPGATYRLLEPRETEKLNSYVATAAVEDGAQSTVTHTMLPVAEQPSLRGFFDVTDNAVEWKASFRDLQLYRLRGTLPKGLSEDTKQAIRLVLDLSQADYRKLNVAATDSEASEEGATP